MSATVYVLRYAAQTPLNLRRHEYTLGRWPSWVDAEDRRQALPSAVAGTLEVVERPARPAYGRLAYRRPLR